MIISLSGATVRPGKESEEARIVERLGGILRGMPGLISYEDFLAEDGEDLTVIRFESEEDLVRWRDEGIHGSYQKVVNDYYEAFWVQSAEVIRGYRWEEDAATGTGPVREEWPAVHGDALGHPVGTVTLMGAKVREGAEAEENQAVVVLDAILREMPGLISSKDYRADDGSWLTVTRFRSEEDLDRWRGHEVHRRYQEEYSRYYQSFWAQTGRIYREYVWREGKRTDGDLSSMFHTS